MKFYVLNTNMQWNRQCDIDMLNEHKASAYGLPYGKNIMKLEQGDKVFLYRNKDGIIAYGIADGNLKTKQFIFNEIAYDEYFMQLDNFIILRSPLPPSKMRCLSNNLAFSRTMYTIDSESGNLFVEEINKNYI